LRRAGQVAISLGGVAAFTWAARVAVPVNAPTAGFGYLLLILVIASAWGFVEALAASVAATLTFNYFFFPPIGAFTIHDPQNWVALLSFLATSIIASRLSAIAKQRALDAVARQQELERLYALSREILMIGNTPPFASQLVAKLADIFQLDAVALYDAETEEIYRCSRAGATLPADERLREAAVDDDSWTSQRTNSRITPIRTESKLIGSLALAGRCMPSAVAQGIANLAAIGM
jgi:two-component system sensor histidine kinase KdpD